MGSLKVIKAGLLTSIQDLGRRGYAFYAIPCSGVMDRDSAILANQIAGNPVEYPLIEMTIVPPEFEFLSDAQICVSGSIVDFKINGHVIPNNKSIHVSSGDILSGNAGQNASRSYLAICGKLKACYHYQSYSTYSKASLGGHQGRQLIKDDIVSWQDQVGIESLSPTLIPFHNRGQNSKIKIYKGPEFYSLSEASKKTLISEKFIISTDSDRMGSRLSGPKINSRLTSLSKSVPVLPGFIQLPPSGHPIVILQDGQTTGGYPRIAYIRSENLSQFNQMPLGSEVFFTM